MSELNANTGIRAEIDATGLATVAGWMTVYAINPTTREYTGTTEEYLPVGVGLPAFSFMDKPAAVEVSEAIVRNTDGDTWQALPDYRGQIAYRCDTREPVIITDIGKLPDALTLLVPQTAYDQWNKGEWVTNIDAQVAGLIAQSEEKKVALITLASQSIVPLQDAVDLQIATDHEVILLEKWKTYRVLLSRIDTATDIEIKWPKIDD